MKAGTALKLVLNLISTSLMIKMERVMGNKMVIMQLTNKKLVVRGTRMIMEKHGIASNEARKLLLKHGSVKKCWSIGSRLTDMRHIDAVDNIWLGLDSWEKGHMMGHKTPLVLDNDRNLIPEAQEEKALRDFAHTWVKALRLMREEGILERAVWVAPMNEVPHFASRSIESVRKTGVLDQNEGEAIIDKNQLLNDRYLLLNLWMGEEIKDEIGRDNIPLSYSSLGGEQYSKRLPEIYDVADVHFMPGVITNPEDSKEFAEITQGHPQDFQGWEKMDLKRWSTVWDRACRNNYTGMLTRVRDFLTSALDNCTFPSGKRLQAVITESFGPCFWPDHPDVSWEWYKHYNGDASRIAASMPFEGIPVKLCRAAVYLMG